jgi:hypothetical protein
MKYGDILGCIYMTSKREIRFNTWIEKTHINRFKAEKYLK